MTGTPQQSKTDAFLLNCRGKVLDCRPASISESGAHVMGILNVTPDSFSDGGEFLEKESALRRVEVMLEEGAAIIDVGGESSRPAGSVYGEGADTVPAGEERSRVVPVVRAIAARFPDAIISVDTYKPDVVEAVLEAGAHIINDVTGLRFHPETADLAAAAGAPLIVMHAIGRPGAMPPAEGFDDVVATVTRSLQDSVRTAEAAGVRHIVTDPGFGFGKTADENLTLIRRLAAFQDLGRPLLIGISRKSTIGAVLGSDGQAAPVQERLFGTLGATARAVMGGASIVRTHDIRPTVEMLRVLAAVL